MEFAFEGEIIYWRGPAPWFFVPVSDEANTWIADHAAELTYGWGVIPVLARIGATEFETSLFPKDGCYLLPVKAAVRRAEGVDEGDVVSASLTAGRMN